MRMYSRHGKTVLANGRTILSYICPCGCPAVFYVDHSRSESGDGKTWDTAFNSINDVFTGKTQRYRNRGCNIYVRIRGTVNYSIAGTGYDSEYKDPVAYIYLMPETDEKFVECELSNIPLFADYYWQNAIVLYRWNIASKTTSEWGLFGHEANPPEYTTILDSTISVEQSLQDFNGINSVYAVRIGNHATIKNSTINVVFDIRGKQNNEAVTSCHGIYNFMSGTFENVNVNLSGNISGLYRVKIYAYRDGYESSSYYNCSSSFSVNVLNASGGYGICRFYNGRGSSNKFKNCTQSCEAHGDFSENNSDIFCEYKSSARSASCLPISNSDELSSIASFSVLSASPSTTCRYAEDTGEKAFPAAPCRGNRIICHKIDGHVSYTKACTPEKCKLFEQS